MEYDIVKLQLIVCRSSLWDSEPTHDVFLDELGDVLVLDASIGFCLYPFTEIVGCYEQKFLLCCCNV